VLSISSLLRHAKTVKGMQKYVETYFKNLAKSTTFLALYCSLGWISLCFGNQVFYNYTSRLRLFSHTWVAGLAVLIEHPSRRSELATYCMGYVVDSLYRWGVFSKTIPEFTPAVGALTIALSTAIMFYNFENHSDLITSWLLGFRKENVAGGATGKSSDGNGDKKKLL